MHSKCMHVHSKLEGGIIFPSQAKESEIMNQIIFKKLISRK